MDFTGIFNTALGWALTTLGGVSLAGIISVIIYGCLKGAFNRAIAKINAEKIAEEVAVKTMDKTVGKVKEISFKQSLQPVIESQLKSITKESHELVQAELEEVKAKYDKLLAVLEALAKYFDNSIGVSDEAKAALKVAIEDAKAEEPEAHVEETIVVKEIELVEEKKAEEPKKASAVRR